MTDYSRLDVLVGRIPRAATGDPFAAEMIPCLVTIWIDAYGVRFPRHSIVETTDRGFSHLFDEVAERLIAAWGMSRGRIAGDRDKARMAGHPLSAGPRFHRGHAIPHRLGGATDINLVPQRGSLNVGAFRALEREAVNAPGSLYFTHWIYGAARSQTPIAVEQGLLCPGRKPDIRLHRN